MGDKSNVEPKLACERRHISSRPSDYFFVSHAIFKAETKGKSSLHSLGSRCFTKKSAFNVTTNFVTVVKFTFQNVFNKTLELYSII